MENVKPLVWVLPEQHHISQEIFPVFESIHELFAKKNHDYGDSWRAFRPASLTDQIFIKIKRLRTVYGKTQLVDDSCEEDFMAMVNYSIMALMNLKQQIPSDPFEKCSSGHLITSHHFMMNYALDVMNAKNHDYGEGWRDLSVNSLIDLILVKVLRLRQMHQVNELLASESVQNNYVDIINYSVFALIHIEKIK